MAQTYITKSDYSDYSTTVKDFSVDVKVTDSAGGQKEYEYTCSKAGQYLGYYKSIPELKIAIDTKATWTIGKGYLSDEVTQLLLMTIKGTGKETFNAILESMIRDYNIYGDAYAEKIYEGKRLVNIKKLDPASMKIVYNEKGLVKEFKYSKGGNEIKFQPEDIFHLSKNRISDEVHGVSIIDSCEWIILARNEAMADFKKLLHRNVYPMRVWHLDTDIETEITEFMGKVAQAKYKGEDMFVPKGNVASELATVSQNSSLNPLPWIQLLNQYFFQAVGVPQIIIGGSQELTQTAAQIAYLAFEQTIEEEQLYIEEQVLSQLNLQINLEFPASLQNNLISDNRKDGTQAQQMNQTSQLVPPMMNNPTQQMGGGR